MLRSSRRRNSPLGAHPKSCDSQWLILMPREMVKPDGLGMRAMISGEPRPVSHEPPLIDWSNGQGEGVKPHGPT